MSPTMVVSSTTTTFLTGRLASCPSCGFDMGPPLEDDPSTRLLESQARIAELETQVCLLTQRLRSQPSITNPSASAPSSSASPPGTAGSGLGSGSGSGSGASHSQVPRASLFQSGASRMAALVYSRASSSRSNSTSTTASTPPPPTPASPFTSIGSGPSSAGGQSAAAVPGAGTGARAGTPASTAGPQTQTQALAQVLKNGGDDDISHRKLLEALEREQSLRRAAETRLSATSKEVEELSAALFEQANEMVAEERRARAKLEERVGELERRDQEKKKRLDRLETAVGRIERARKLLEESDEVCRPAMEAKTSS